MDDHDLPVRDPAFPDTGDDLQTVIARALRGAWADGVDHSQQTERAVGAVLAAFPDMSAEAARQAVTRLRPL